MTNSITERRDIVQAELIESQEALKGLHKELCNVTQELDSLLAESQQYQILGDICSSLDKLEEMGAAELFWGEGTAGPEQERQLERVRSVVGEFQQKVDSIENNKKALQARIEEQEIQIENLHDALDEIEEQVERAKYDYIIEREERPLPYRPMIMPWTRQGEDEKRFRKSLALVFLFVMALSGLIRVWEVPEINKEEIEVPEHLVKLVKKQKPKPKPPEPKKEEKKEEKKDEKKEDKKPEKQEPTPAEKQKARKVAENTGVLAFKDNFSDLMDDDVSEKLGATATLTNEGSKAKEDGSRNIVTAQAKAGSGGITTSATSRGVSGGAGKRMGDGVSFSRVESSIGTDAADERPLSDDSKPARTDEEIQIVFDRYKTVLYRIYNRELRKDPTLRGKMVLRITIKPDGTVSVAKVESTDMDSATLSSNIVARVKRFNFGPKEGVPTTTILYPIDFLPAS
ncbi:MAG: AgmX/PglI C-terminal domain-containing protein [Pseudomonadota bacterium]